MTHTPTTKLGRVLLTGGDDTPHPRDACATPADVDATLAERARSGLALTAAEAQDVAHVKAHLGRRR